MLIFEVLPFTMLASSVNGKTSNKSMQKRRGGSWCVKTLTVTFEACRKCANRIDSFSRLDKYNIPVSIKTVCITFRVAACIDAL